MFPFLQHATKKVDGMEDSSTGSSARGMEDPDAKKRHMLRLEKRRGRAAQASKEEAATHGYGQYFRKGERGQGGRGGSNLLLAFVVDR